MQFVKTIFILLLTFSIGQFVFAQNAVPSCMAAPKDFNDCAAVFLNNKMVVSEYSTRGKSVVASGVTGMLSVSPIQLSLTDLIGSMQPVGFKVAIRNEETNTLWLFSEETYKEVPIEKILAECKRGDKIVLLTVDKKFSLPHNEIEIMWGC